MRSPPAPSRCPRGRIAVFGPPPGYDLSALSPAALTLVSHDAVATRHWQAAGHAVTRAPSGPFAAAVVILPRARDAQKALLAEAAALAPLVLVDGQKHDGVETILKAVKARAPIAGTLSKAHGKLFWVEGASFPDWAAQARDVDACAMGFRHPPRRVLGRRARQGLAGAGGGLAAAQGHGRRSRRGLGLSRPSHPRERSGHPGAPGRDRCRRPRLRPRERDRSARGVPLGRRDQLAPAEALLDTVVSNPPFHRDRAGDPGLGRAFIAAAARMLAPSGSFWMVANRHLPYEAELAAAFSVVEEIGGTPGFKVIHARKPRRARR